MDSKITSKEKSQVEILVTASWEEFQPFLDKAASQLSDNMKVKGFRPGKAPWREVEKIVGSEKLLREAANEAVKKLYTQVVMDNNVRALGSPSVEVLKLAPENPFQFKAVADIMPEVKLSDYRSKLQNSKPKKEESKVEEKEVEDTIKQLQNSRAKYKTVSRSAQKGDRVEVDFEIQENGVPIEGGQSKNHPIVLGDKKFIPGFEENLEGMKESEEKNFEIKVPQTFPQKQIAGKDLSVHAKVDLVQKKEIPEADDEFAKSLGQFESMEGLRGNIKEGLKKEKDQKEKEKRRSAMLEVVAGDMEVELPQSLVDGTLNQMVSEFKSNIESGGVKFDDYLSHIGKTEEDLKKEWIKAAEKRAKSSLALSQLAEAENIQVDEKEVEAKANEILSSLPNPEEFSKKVSSEQLKEYAYGILKNEKTFERMEQIASN